MAQVPAGYVVGVALTKLLAYVATSVAVSYVSGRLQPKNKDSSREGQAGDKITTSNDGAAPQALTLGQDRDAGSLVWWVGHPPSDQHNLVTIVTAHGEVPDPTLAKTRYEGPVKELIDEFVLEYGTDLVPYTGQFAGGSGSRQLDSNDWVPSTGDGKPGDYWWRSNTSILYYKKGNSWKSFSGITITEGSLPDPSTTTADYAIVGNNVYKIGRQNSYGYDNRDDASTGNPPPQALTWIVIARLDGSGGFPKWFHNKTTVPNNASRWVHWESGNNKYEWHLKVRWHLGDQTAADAYLLAISNEKGDNDWTTAHIGKNTVYKVVTFRFHPDLFGSSFPPQNGSIFKGIRIYDPRRAATGTSIPWFGKTVRSNQVVWTDNAALCTQMLKLWPSLPGALKSYAGLNEADLINSANISDESVNIPGGGTEPRYTINGTVKNNIRRMDVEEDAEIALGGNIVQDDLVRILAGTTVDLGSTPIITEDDILSEYTEIPWPETRQRVNTVLATFFQPGVNYVQSTTGPISVDKSAEGGESIEDSISLGFAGRSLQTARSQARIWLRKKQLYNKLILPIHARAMDFRLSDVIRVNTLGGQPGEPLTGLNSKAYTIEGMEEPLLPAYDNKDNIAFTVILQLTEYNADTWDRPGDTVDNDDSTDLRLGDWSDVGTPTNIVVTTAANKNVVGPDGNVYGAVRVSMNAPRNDMWDTLEIQYRLDTLANFYSGGLSSNTTGYEDEIEWQTVRWQPRNRIAPTRVIHGIRAGAWYQYRARVRSLLTGSWSDDIDDISWGNEVMYSIPYLNQSTDPPPDFVLWPNPYFDRGFEGLSIDANSDGTASIERDTDNSLGEEDLVLVINSGPNLNDFTEVSFNPPLPVEPRAWYSYEIVAMSISTGPSYSANNHQLSVYVEYLTGSDLTIQREINGGPIRDEERDVGRAGPAAFNSNRFDPGAHQTIVTVRNVLQIPGFYAIKKMRLNLGVFNLGQETEWKILAIKVGKILRFPGPINFTYTRTGGVSNQASRNTDTYQNVLGFRNAIGTQGNVEFKRFYPPVLAKNYHYVTITASAIIDATAVTGAPSGTVRGFIRFFRCLRSVGQVSERPMSDPNTLLADLVNASGEGAANDWEYLFGSVAQGEVSQPFSFQITFKVPQIYPLPDYPGSTSSPIQKDDLIYRTQVTTNAPNGKIIIQGSIWIEEAGTTVSLSEVG